MLFAEKLRQLREEKQSFQRQLATALKIETPMSRIERCDRQAKREQVIILAKIFQINENDLLKLWLADKVYEIIEKEDYANDILNIVASGITEYKKSK